MSGDAASRLTAMAERCERDPAAVAAPELRSAGDALAIELEGEPAWRWRIAVLRAVMAAPPDGDAVRETYGELVDRYRDDAERLALLRAIGDEIRRLEAAGTLPSAMVARSDRRPRR